jgi:hypothetical protein
MYLLRKIPKNLLLKMGSGTSETRKGREYSDIAARSS